MPLITILLRSLVSQRDMYIYGPAYTAY